jgi:predicted esterase
MNAADYPHHYQPAASPGTPTLLLLHGTGGNEHSMLGLGQQIAQGATMLSPRGRVLENGMARFFRRFAEGVFDEDDLRARTQELAAFVLDAAEQYAINVRTLIAVGYSNGANMAASLLLLRPDVLRCAVMLRPMLPLHPDPPPDLSEAHALISAGRADQMVPADRTQALIDALYTYGAQVTVAWQDADHRLVAQDIEAARRWVTALHARSSS